MDLQPYVDAVRHELNVAAAAAEEITGELAPRSVEVRLRGRDPEFIVSAPLDEEPIEDADKVLVAQYDDDGATWRVTLRLPGGLRAAVEAAARREGASLNSWLVRAAAGASQRGGPADSGRSTNRTTSRRVTGWMR